MKDINITKEGYVIVIALIAAPVIVYKAGGIIDSAITLFFAEAMCMCLAYIIIQHRWSKQNKRNLEEDNFQQNTEIQQLTKKNKALAEDLDILANAGYGIWKIYMYANGQNKMVIDDKIKEILGIKEKNLSPEEVYTYYHERLEDYSDIEQEDYNDMFQGRLMTRLLTWNHPGKGKINLRAGGTIHTDEKGVCYISGYCTDVTEQVKNEERMNNKLQLALENEKRANAAKDAFLASMSHDIRTPLNCIIGLLELSKNHPDNRQMVDENREKARVAADHLLELINDILEVTKLNVDKVILGHEAFNIRALGDDIETVVKEQALERGIAFISENEISDFSDKLYLFGSPLHLRQVFLNIYSNSIKYNKPGGSVSVRKELVDKTDTTITYKFIISDTGIGMSKTFLEHLYEPFTQEHASARSTYQGTGLGMYIVQRLVEMMHGSITVTSKEGLGTTFEIVIPFEIATKADLPEKVDISKADINGMKVLVVEDNGINAEIIKRILIDFGAVVTIAVNGKEAVESFTTNPPGTYDVILMDLMMPVMDGYAATKAIRAFKRSDAAEIPIYAVTANAFEDDVKKCLEVGMDGHLAKPIDVKKLKTTLVNVYKG